MQAAPTIKISSSDRVTVVGATGSGKSVLVRAMMQRFPDVIVHDEKGTFPLGDARRLRSISEVRSVMASGTRGHFIYSPNIDELGDQIIYDELAELVYKRQHTILVIDETYAVTEGQKIGRWLKACITRGRERDVGVWALTQRPKFVPNFFFSEAEHIFVFRLNLEDDKKKLAGFVGDGVYRRIPRYHFLYRNVIDGTSIITHIDPL